jgi:hypothetical protein
VSVYLWYQARLAAGPAIPFDELPLETQEVIISDIEMGYKSIEAGDWDGASRYFMDAYDLHPRNADIEEGLERVRDMVLERAAGMTNLRQKEYLLKLVDAYSEHAFFENDDQMRELREKLRAELD